MSGFGRDFHQRDDADLHPAPGSLPWMHKRVMELDDEIVDLKATNRELIEMQGRFLRELPGIIEQAVKSGTKAALTDEETVQTFLGVALGVGAQNGAKRFALWTLSGLKDIASFVLKVVLVAGLAFSLGGWPLVVKAWHFMWSTTP